MDTQRPHCLVVGVGPGTGLACVRRFIDEGYKVSMIARHEGRLESWAREIPDTVGYPADLTELPGSRAVLERIKTEQGQPKVIIYNASLATLGHYTELDAADLERNFRANTTGPAGYCAGLRSGHGRGWRRLDHHYRQHQCPSRHTALCRFRPDQGVANDSG